jgi:hypothetical protein
MALPKIDTPTFMLELPSTKENIKYRPFTVKEEKILLMATQSEDGKEIGNAINQIIINCVDDLNPKFDLKRLTMYDTEYIFLNLRSKSVNNIITLTVTDPDDESEHEVEVNLDEVKVQFDPEHKNEIVINSNVTLMMKDPSYDNVSVESSDDIESNMSIVKACIDKILVDDDVVVLSDHTQEEQDTFMDSLSSKNMQDIMNFLTTLPKLKHEVKYKVKNKNKTISVEGLASFFI